MTRHLLMASSTALALGLSASHAIAHSAAGEGKNSQAHRAAQVTSHHRSREAHRRAIAHRSERGAGGQRAPTFYAAPPAVPVYRWPGYTYVPRKGIVDEACNLPTSACPNEMRDIR
jgi:hypothetical protein